MDKKRLTILERAFEAEVEGSIKGHMRLMQTKSKLAAIMVDEGLLVKATERIGNEPLVATVEGYELTHLGRAVYCANC